MQRRTAATSVADAEIVDGAVGLGSVRLNRWTWETRGAEQQDSVSVTSNALFPALRDVMCVMFPRSA